jgi:hypothetical protein
LQAIWQRQIYESTNNKTKMTQIKETKTKTYWQVDILNPKFKVKKDNNNMSVVITYKLSAKEAKAFFKNYKLGKPIELEVEL